MIWSLPILESEGAPPVVEIRPSSSELPQQVKKKAIQAGLAALITQYVILWASQLKEKTLRCTNFLRCQFFFLCILLVFSSWKWKSTESESHGTESFHQKRLLSNSAESQGLGNNLRSSKVQHCWHSQDVWNFKVGYLYFLIVSGFHWKKDGHWNHHRTEL